MKFLINGESIDKSDHYDVINPYNGEIVDTVPIAYRSDVDNAVLEISHGQFQFTCSQTDLKYILKFPTITTHFNTV